MSEYDVLRAEHSFLGKGGVDSLMEIESFF